MNHHAAGRGALGRRRNQRVATTTAALVEAASKGDEQAWAELVEPVTIASEWPLL